MQMPEASYMSDLDFDFDSMESFLCITGFTNTIAGTTVPAFA
jgi:hypothetical protein